jgi:hypothetical protein
MSHVARIVRQFGSQQALGGILQISQSSISDWVKAGRIPARHQRAILLAARERGLDITAEDLIGVERKPAGEAA